MTSKSTTELKRDFLEWSGGFPPDCDHQIFVYLTLTRIIHHCPTKAASAAS